MSTKSSVECGGVSSGWKNGERSYEYRYKGYTRGCV